MNIWKVRGGTPKSCDSGFWGGAAGSRSWCLCTERGVPTGRDPDPEDAAPAGHWPRARQQQDEVDFVFIGETADDSAAASGKAWDLWPRELPAAGRKQRRRSRFLLSPSAFCLPPAPSPDGAHWSLPHEAGCEGCLDLWFKAKVYGHRQSLPHCHLFIQPPSTRFYARLSFCITKASQTKTQLSTSAWYDVTVFHARVELSPCQQTDG